jgi:hypothetical protein
VADGAKAWLRRKNTTAMDLVTDFYSIYCEK